MSQDRIFIVRTRQRPWLLLFLGKHAYCITEESLYSARKSRGNWYPLLEVSASQEAAQEVADRHWAIQNNPMLVLLYGCVNWKLIRYRQEWADEWGISFWGDD